MKKVEDYRQHATECRMMASRSRSPEEKTMLMNISGLSSRKDTTTPTGMTV
jgi:hypothetical protein